MKGKISRTSLSEQICDIIKESIINGDFADQEKLPSEMELVELYNVSRLTVRSALQRLNALGLVTTKAGNGTYVNKFNIESTLNDLPSTRILNSTLLRSVKEFRSVIDSECIRLAIANATFDDLERLRIACEEYKQSSEASYASVDEKFMKLSEADFKIHMIICEISHNPLFVTAYSNTQDYLKSYFYTIAVSRYKRADTLGMEKYFQAIIDGHMFLYEAIKERDIAKATKVIQNHIDYNVLALSKEDFK